jgi:NADPH-dependent ferric siderophore reductase
VEVDHAAECPDIAAPPGLAVHRLERSAGQTLEHALASADLGPAGARHVWFAAEKRRASAMRQFLRQKRNVDRAESYVAAYWSDILS